MLCIWHALSRCNSAEDKKAAIWSKSNRKETVVKIVVHEEGNIQCFRTML